MAQPWCQEQPPCPWDTPAADGRAPASHLGKQRGVFSLRSLKLQTLLPPPPSSAVCQAEPPAPSPKVQELVLCSCPCSQRTAALPFPGHLSQLPHPFHCIYGHLICVSSRDQIYLQVLINFRLIEVQAQEVSVFDPQIGYESQSNRLIFTRSRCPGLQAVREKSMKSANDSQFIEQLPF